MIDPHKAIRKLKKPPGVHNWVKNLRKRRGDMALSLYNTAVNAPRHSLRQVTDVIKSIVTDELSVAQALKCIERISNPRVRGYGREILSAIYPYIRERGWKGVQIFSDMVEYYRVAANVNVPVRPTFVINDGQKVIPYFVICWATIGLSDYQKSILSTLIHEAILTLEDFQNSDAVIVCIPRYRFSKTERHVIEWKVSDHALLDSEAKSDLFERYGYALADAEQMILENIG